MTEFALFIIIKSDVDIVAARGAFYLQHTTGEKPARAGLGYDHWSARRATSARHAARGTILGRITAHNLYDKTF